MSPSIQGTVSSRTWAGENDETWALVMRGACAGGPHYAWDLAAGQTALSFEITVAGSSQSATQPWQLSHLCQQDVVVLPANGSQGYTQPAFTSGQIASCVYAPLGHGVRAASSAQVDAVGDIRGSQLCATHLPGVKQPAVCMEQLFCLVQAGTLKNSARGHVQTRHESCHVSQRACSMQAVCSIDERRVRLHHLRRQRSL